MSPQTITTAGNAELSVNLELRRKGEVSIGVAGTRAGFAWVTAAEARAFGFALLGAARDSEDQAQA